MFGTTEMRPAGFSPGLFVAQLALAPLAVLILGLLSTVILEGVLKTRGNTLSAYACYLVEGFWLGGKVQTAFPRSLQSGGLWIWILPSVVLALSLITELKQGPDAQLAGFFIFPNRPGLDGIQLVLITLPFVASCCFSIGVWVISKPARTEMERRLRTVFGLAD